MINYVSEHQAERLTLLIEEAAEVQQAAAKILRFGLDSSNPLDPNSPDNRELLERELGDLMLIALMLSYAGDININVSKEWMQKKVNKLKRYLTKQDPKWFSAFVETLQSEESKKH